MHDGKKAVLIKFFVGTTEYANRTVYHVPRVGDELRFSDGKYYTLKRILWVYDEEDYIYSRANVLMEERGEQHKGGTDGKTAVNE